MNELWELYKEIHENWKGYIIVVARNNRIEPDDLLDAVIDYLIDYKVDNIKQLIHKKAYELRYKKELPISKFYIEDEKQEEKLFEVLQFYNYEEPQEQIDWFSGLPEELRTYLLSRVRIEKTLPIQERVRFRQKLREAQKLLGGQQ
ncbi:hypothetical protein [Persephonella sp.]|uniref:hypothetical protein n=1 Tax=Persephonella sp. TaxID=2060922 RepID=UPI00260294F6|nr:hypothetical protein [Persephonella sp.]